MSRELYRNKSYNYDHSPCTNTDITAMSGKSTSGTIPAKGELRVSYNMASDMLS